MSTIQKILDSLSKINEDKKQQLTGVYHENSLWLSNELELIKKLINQNPREHIENGTNYALDCDETTKDDEINQKKRKSSDTNFNARSEDIAKVSPNQKRSSGETEKLFFDAGLPIDLNKLKKEQLLVELEKRGFVNFSMKTLKNILVDTLRDAIKNTNDKNNQFMAENNISVDLMVELSDSVNAPMFESQMSEPEIVPLESCKISSNSSTETKYIRKGGSLINNIRAAVNTSDHLNVEKIDVSLDEVKYQEKIRDTFIERQNRHRDSQARKSGSIRERTDSESSINEAVEIIEEESVVPATIQPTFSQPAVSTVPTNDDLKIGIADIKIIQSPPPVAKFHDSPDSDADDEEENDNLVTVSSPVAGNKEKLEEEYLKSLKKPTKPTSPSSQSSTEETNIQLSESSKSLKDAIMQQSLDENAKSQTSTVLPPKKTPTNLIVQKSFLPPTNKPVVSSIEQARKLKEAEAKKKKELLEKKLGQQQNDFNNKSSPKSKFTSSNPTSKQNPVSKVFNDMLGKINPPKPSPALVVQTPKVEQSKPISIPIENESISVVESEIKLEIKDVKKNETIPISTPLCTPQIKNVLQEINPTQLPSISAPTNEEQKLSPMQTIVIEDRESSDDDDDDSEGTGDEAEKPAQTIPEWARGVLLKEALERQNGLHPGFPPKDPDQIFYEVKTCNLEEIFGRQEGLTRKYNNRTSSAKWDADEMSLVEKRTYRKQMGYDAHLSSINSTPIIAATHSSGIC
eukprot:gene6031-8305_t